MNATRTAQHQSSVAEEVLRMFRERGDSNYGQEAVTQLQHALQAACLAEREQATPALIVAALLHDIGHLLHDLPPDAPEQGLDDRHEILAAQWLRERFDRDVAEPVALHVDAKRYLCVVDPDYARQLSPPSFHSLGLQGGPMTSAEIRRFEDRRCFRQAVRSRRWDDDAKTPGLATPPIEHFLEHIENVRLEPK